MADQPVSSPIADNPSHERSKNDAATSFSLLEDVYKPAANVGIETYNAAANAVNLVTPGEGLLPKAALYDVRHADFLSPSWFGQTISSGLATAGVFAVGGRFAGAGLAAGAERFALTGTAARIATSQQTSLMLAGTAFDGFRDVREGETRLTNIAGGAAAMLAFGQFNSLARELPTAGRLATQALGGSTGSLAQVAISDWSQGRSIDEEQFWHAAVGGAITNLAIPPMQNKIGDAFSAARSAKNSVQQWWQNSDRTVGSSATSEQAIGSAPVFAASSSSVGELMHEVQRLADMEMGEHKDSQLPNWGDLHQMDRVSLVKSLDKTGVKNLTGRRVMYSAISGDDPFVRTLAFRNISKLPDADQAIQWRIAWNKAEDPAERRFVLGTLPHLSQNVRRQALEKTFNLRKIDEHASLAMENAHDQDTRGMLGEIRERLRLDAGKTNSDLLHDATRDMAPDEKSRLLQGVFTRSRDPWATSPEPLPAPLPQGREVIAKIDGANASGKLKFPAVEYDLPGHTAKLIVGRDLARHFPTIRQVRSDLLSNNISDETFVNRFAKTALPEDYAKVLSELPDRRLYDRVIVPVGRGAEPLVEWAKKEPAAGHVVQGEPDIYIHQMRYDDFFRTLHFHEYGHLMENAASPAARQAYDASAKRETYHLRDYGWKRPGENFSVHGGEAMLGPRSTFEHAAKEAPLRSAVFGRMLQDRLITLPPEMRSTMHGEWEDRIDFLERNIVPVAQRLAARELATARFANQSEPMAILSYLRPPGKSWLSELRSSPPQEGLNVGSRPVDAQDGALLRAMQVKRLSMRAEDTDKVQAQPYVKTLTVNGTMRPDGFSTIPKGSLAGLKNFRSVENLTINADSLPASDLLILSEMPNVRSVTVIGDANPAVVHTLASVPTIERIALQNANRKVPITRETLEPLPSMPNLRSVHLGTHVREDALKALAGATNIRELGVNDVISPSDSRVIADLPSLEKLIVPQEAMSLDSLKDAKQLKHLVFIGDPTEAQGRNLKRLTQLKDITMVQQDPSSRREANYQKALPHARVSIVDTDYFPDDSIFARK